MRSRHTIICILLFLLAMLMHGCTAAYVDFCYDEHPHRGELLVEFDWSEVEEVTIPDSMVVWAVRPYFRTKVTSNWATSNTPNNGGNANGNEGDDNGGGVDEPTTPGDDTDVTVDPDKDNDTEVDVDADGSRTRSAGTRATDSRLFARIIAPVDDIYSEPWADVPFRDTIFVTPGEWVLSAYSSSEPAIEAAKKFTLNLTDEGDMLFFTPTTSAELPPRYRYWYDRNPYTQWVDVSPESSILLGRAELSVDEYATRDKQYTVRFTPQPITQTITFRLEAEVLDPAVTVDSIVCAVSGVIAGMNVETMAFSIARTYQGLFHTEVTQSPDGLLLAEGKVYAPGLVRSNHPDMLQGPGILNVCVFVHYFAEDGETKYRRLDGTINLYRLLTDNPSIVYSPAGEIVQSGRKVDLYIKTRLQISKDKISSATDAIDPWVDESVIDTDLN